MNPRLLFEAVMRASGHADFSMTSTGRYKVGGLQTRWKYFRMGWEMRATHAKEV